MRRGYYSLLIALGVAATVPNAAAWAQTASQVQPNYAPPNAAARQVLVFGGEPGLGAPDGAESLSVSLAGVAIEGGKPELNAATEALRTALTGRVSVAGIFSRARDLEAAYANAGYFLARVVVPAQRLEDGGTLRLTVVDGYIESIDADDLPEPARSRVVALVEPLLNRPGVTMSEVERRLLLAGDTPGLAMKTALASGGQPGGVVLVVDAELKSIVPFIGVDNTLPDALGHWAVVGGIDFNSLLGAGETIYLRAAGHPRGNDDRGLLGLFDNDPRYRSLTAGGIMPIGLDGLTLKLEGTITQTTPEAFGGVQFSSQYENLLAQLRYPLIRSRELTLNGAVTFDIQNEYQDILGPVTLPVSEDRVRALRFTMDGVTDQEWGTVSGSATFSLGVDAFGASEPGDAVPLSRQGASANFQKLEVALGYAQMFTPHVAFSLSARAQTSFGDPLVRSEQFGIANLGELSTFDSGAVVGDSGWVVRAELSSPFDFQMGDVSVAAAPYLFGAVGSVVRHQPTALEAGTVNAQSVGAGIRLGGAIEQATPSVTLEYGRAFRSDGPTDDRFTVVGSVTF